MNRMRRWIKWMLIGVAALVLGCFLFGQLFLEKMLRKRIREEVQKLEEQHFTLSFDTILIDPLRFQLEMQQIRLRYDSSFPVAADKAFILSGEAELLKLSEIDLLDAVLRRKISMRAFQFKKPRIRLSLNPGYVPPRDPDSLEEQEQRNPYDYGIEHFFLESAEVEVEEAGAITYRASIGALDYHLVDRFVKLRELSALSLGQEQDSLHLRIPAGEVSGFNLSRLITERNLRFKSGHLQTLALDLPASLSSATRFNGLRQNLGKPGRRPSKPLTFDIGDILIDSVRIQKGYAGSEWHSACLGLKLHKHALQTQAIHFAWSPHPANRYTGELVLAQFGIDSIDISRFIADKQLSTGRWHIQKPRLRWTLNAGFIPAYAAEPDSLAGQGFQLPAFLYRMSGLSISQGSYELRDPAQKVIFQLARTDLDLNGLQVDGLYSHTAMLYQLRTSGSFLLLSPGNQNMRLRAIRPVFRADSLNYHEGRGYINIVNAETNIDTCSWSLRAQGQQARHVKLRLKLADVLIRPDAEQGQGLYLRTLRYQHDFMQWKQAGEAQELASRQAGLSAERMTLRMGSGKKMACQVESAAIQAQNTHFKRAADFDMRIQNWQSNCLGIGFEAGRWEARQLKIGSGRWDLQKAADWKLAMPAMQCQVQEILRTGEARKGPQFRFSSLQAQAPGFEFDQLKKQISIRQAALSLKTRGFSISDKEVLSAQQISWTQKKFSYSDLKLKNQLDLSQASVNLGQLSTPIRNLSFDQLGLVSLSVKAGTAFFKPGKGLYNLYVESADYNPVSQRAVFKRFRIDPKLSKKEFSQQVNRTIARIDATIPTFSIYGLSVNDFLKNRLECKSARMESPLFEFYKDQNIPLRPNDYKRAPQDLIRNIAMPLHIPSIEISDGHIVFEGLGKEAEKTGVLTFDHIHGKLLDFGNIYSNKTFTLDLDCQFMGKADMHATMEFPMRDQRNPFNTTFSIGKMPFKAMNAFLGEYASIMIESGNLLRVDAQFKGNEDSTATTLTLQYDELKVNIVTREDKRRKGLMTLAANAVLLSSNPSDGVLRSSQMVTDNQDNLFVIGNWMKGFTKAMLHTMSPGVSKILDKREQRRARKGL